MAGEDGGYKLESVVPDDFGQHCEQNTDSSGLCRLCLLHFYPSKMTQLFPSVSSDSWKTIIANITNIEVTFGDGLPALICSLCISTLNQTREFKEKSIAGDNLLRNVLFQPFEGADAEVSHPTDQLSTDNGAALPCVYKQHEGIAEMSGFCRLCVTYFSPDNMTPIFEGNGPDSLPDKITSVTGVKVQRGDGLPASICDCCVGKLRRASKFIENAGAKDNYLRTELFQAVREVSELDTPNDPLALDLKPKVKLEPADKAFVAKADKTNLPEPTEEGENADTGEEQDLKDDAEHVLPANVTPHEAKETGSSGERFETNLQQPLSCHLCKKLFVTKAGVLRHLREVHKWSRKPLKCDKCTRVFNCQAYLDAHKLVGHQPKVKKSFTCDVCKKTFGVKSDCRRHVTAVHCGVKAEKRFQCDVCKKMFWCKLSCSRHILTHPEVKSDIAPSFQCEFCEKKFWFKLNLVRHIASHSEAKSGIEKTVKCEICEKRFWAKASCLSHMRVHSAAKPFKCQVCEKGFKSLTECKKHQAVHSTERPHKCEICKKSFKCIPGLKQHLARHSSNERRFACKICNLRFFTLSNLKCHQAAHSKARPHACNECEKTYKTRGHLWEHMKTHEIKTFICTLCGKSLANEKNYNDHLRQHTGDLPFKCKVCEKAFPRKGNLTKHMETHAERKVKYQCHICKKLYTRKQTLTKHLNTHQDRPKPFVCALCPSRYNNKTALKDHIRSKHAKETPHKCGVCGKGYFVKGELTIHVNAAHTGERPYKCESCDATFCRRQTLQKHIRRMHLPVTFYECSKCGKKFRQKESMMKHSCKYIGPRPFVCEVCGSDFRTLNNVGRHVALVHSDARPHKCTKCDKYFKTKGAMNKHLKSHKAE